jgi:dCTP deaminase
MTLSRKDLIARLRSDDWAERLVVEPFFWSDRDMNSPSPSLDFHLGNRFSVLRRRRATQHNPLPTDGETDVAPTELFIPLGKDFFLHPGQIVLGTTLEWFRFPYDLMAYVIGRSIWGRRGLLIVTASAVHPGSSGTITLELCNMGEVAVVLRPGVAVGQLFFHKVGIGASEERPENRQSIFSASTRPMLGEYVPSPIERFLLEIQGAAPGPPVS